MDLSNRRVLVVDDDSKSREVFRLILSSMNFDVAFANNGEEAMEILAEDSYFDLIITDIMMPYMTGFDLVKKLKGYAETKNIPVIATSAFHDWHKAREEHELEVDGFVPKPVKKETLQTELKRIFGE